MVVPGRLVTAGARRLRADLGRRRENDISIPIILNE